MSTGIDMIQSLRHLRVVSLVHWGVKLLTLQNDNLLPYLLTDGLKYLSIKSG